MVRIFGPDLDVLRDKADEVTKEIAEVDGVIDAAAELEAELPHIEVEANLAAAGRYGLKPGRHPPAVLHALGERGSQ